MASQSPFDQKKIDLTATHLSRSVANEPYLSAAVAFSYHHALNVEKIKRAENVKRKPEDLYWGALVLTKSFLLWGGSNLNDSTFLVLPLEQIDVVNLHPQLGPLLIRNRPPSYFHKLTVAARNSQMQFSSGGALGNARQEVEWAFAVSASSGERLIELLYRQGHEDGSSERVWVLERDGRGRVLRNQTNFSHHAEGVVSGSTGSGMSESLVETAEDFGSKQLQMMYCGQCGAKNPEASNFCARCGERLFRADGAEPATVSNKTRVSGLTDQPTLSAAFPNSSKAPTLSRPAVRPVSGLRWRSLVQLLTAVVVAGFAGVSGFRILLADDCASVSFDSVGGRRVSAVQCFADNSGTLPAWLVGLGLVLVAAVVLFLGFLPRAKYR